MVLISCHAEYFYVLHSSPICWKISDQTLRTLITIHIYLSFCLAGEISDEFDLTVGSPVNSATFHKASYNQGYDLYLTSVEAPVLFSVSLLNGKIDVIRGRLNSFLKFCLWDLW